MPEHRSSAASFLLWHSGRSPSAGGHHVYALSQPVLETDLAEPRVVARNERALAQFGTEVARVGSATTSRGSLRAPRPWRISSSKRNCWGPATSTVPFTGAPTAILPTALATSSAAMGWMSTGGSRTVVPSVAASAMRLTNSKNCVAWTIEYGIADALDQLLLRDLRSEVAASDSARFPRPTTRRDAPRRGCLRVRGGCASTS